MSAPAMMVRGANLEDNLSVGGCTVFPGITIGDGALIRGGSVITHDVPPWKLAHGLPVRTYEMPTPLRAGYRPEFMFPQLDLWGPYHDPSFLPEE